MAFYISANILQEAEAIPITNSYFPVDECYFSSSLKFISEMKNEYRAASLSLYNSLNESADQIAINESFSDFISSVKNIIKKFLNYIKSLFERFITALNSIIKSDKYLKQHKTDFGKFDHTMEFDMEVYNYSIDLAIPEIHALTTFEKEFNEIKKSLENITDPQKASDELRNIYNKLSNDIESTLDEMRGKVLGGKISKISAGDFASELFDIYRDGGTKDTVTVDASIVQSAYIRFANYNDELKKVKRTKSDIEREYKEIENSLSEAYTIDADHIKLSGTSVGDYTMTVIATAQMQNTMELFMKTKADQVTQMSAIHTMAISAKMDAMKDCFKQDKTILYKALAKIQKANGKTAK